MPIQGEEQADVFKRLNRIEGQVKGIRRMVEEESYCVDVLIQIASIHEALRGVGKIILRDHLKCCVTEAVQQGDAERTERTYQELMDLMYKYAR